MSETQNVFDYSQVQEVRENTWTGDLVYQSCEPHDGLARHSQAISTGKCVYCSAPYSKVLEAVAGAELQGAMSWKTTFACDGCGWWSYEARGDLDDFNHYTIAMLRIFPIKAVELPVQALLAELAKRPKGLYELTPKNKEQVVASILRGTYDCEVNHVGRSGDGGIDVLVLQGSETIVVQVKGHKNSGIKEGVAVVRDLLGACILSQARRAIIFSTAIDFSRPAKDAAQLASRVEPFVRIELVDFTKFVSILHLAWSKTTPPWKVYFERQEFPWSCDYR